ncbi:MAG: hypothetical protein H6719_27250 [Sandaracinaceae bacterium]|nr:hypothetical protein [Sandaracinaceae bacterium]
MGARVYRGFDGTAAFASVTRILLAYGGGFVVLWALGLVVRGWRGWLLVLAPLVFLVGTRLWAWRRVSVELADGVLRYEGVSSEDDFEVPLDAIRRVYRDRMLDGAPLVIVLDGEDERVLARLRPARAEELRAALVARGAEAIQAA